MSGWLKVGVVEGDSVICSKTEPVSLLARNEWCGLVSLPEILAAFILPNDAAVMTILNRAAELLREHTGRSAFNGYQDKSRRRAWEQVAAIYKAVGELGIRYIVAPASFENTGQKVRSPADILIAALRQLPRFVAAFFRLLRAGRIASAGSDARESCLCRLLAGGTNSAGTIQ